MIDERGYRKYFHKSSYSCDANGGCVEVAGVEGAFVVKDSKHANSPILVFNRHEWDCFIKGVKDGQFDNG